MRIVYPRGNCFTSPTDHHLAVIGFEGHHRASHVVVCVRAAHNFVAASRSADLSVCAKRKSRTSARLACPGGSCSFPCACAGTL